MTRAPDDSAAVSLAYPFRGDWLVQNSPANRVPSHGTWLFATSHAIDFVPVDADGRSARFTPASMLRPEPPERFVGFGRSVLAPVSGTVVAAHDGEPDHGAYRGLPSIGYALTQRRRAARGWVGLAGNHVVIAIDERGPFVALCHLRSTSVGVRVGRRVSVGDRIGECGNSGNSTEPHLHVQVVDTLAIERANGLPLTFAGGLPRNGEIVRPSQE